MLIKMISVHISILLECVIKKLFKLFINRFDDATWVKNRRSHTELSSLQNLHFMWSYILQAWHHKRMDAIAKEIIEIIWCEIITHTFIATGVSLKLSSILLVVK